MRLTLTAMSTVGKVLVSALHQGFVVSVCLSDVDRAWWDLPWDGDFLVQVLCPHCHCPHQGTHLEKPTLTPVALLPPRPLSSLALGIAGSSFFCFSSVDPKLQF